MSSDNGLQPERTVMAWQRTALGLGGVSVLLLHQTSGRLGRSLAGAAAGLLIALGMLILVEVRHARRHGDDENSPMGTGAVRGLAIVTVMLSLVCFAVVVTQHS